MMDSSSTIRFTCGGLKKFLIWLAVGSVWRIYIDGGIVPALLQSVMLGQTVFHLRFHYGIFVGTWIEVNFSVPEALDGIDVLVGRTPTLAERIYMSAYCHSISFVNSIGTMT